MAYRVIHCISGDSRHGKHDEKPLHLERPLEVGIGGEGPQREKEGIPREDRCDDEARLAENDEKDQHISPDAEIVEDIAQMSVEVKKKVDEGEKQIGHNIFFPFPV
jgi:hypothetical protein